MRKIAILALFCCISPLFADLTSLNSNEFRMADLGKHKQTLAREFAKQLNNEMFAGFMLARMDSRNATTPMHSMLQEYTASSRDSAVENLRDYVSKLDLGIRKAKGIEGRVSELLEVRLVVSAQGELKKENVLVAYIPDGNEKTWNGIEAFDMQGQSHKLDTYKAPEHPVLLVGLDARKDMRAGLALMNEELQKAGMQTPMPTDREGLEVAKLNYIRLNDDQEPWILGDAEIYTLVNGIAPEAEKANVLSMEMPYLVSDDKDYHPNQVLIIWKNYRYMAANLNIYEHDDNTNYKEIAAMLIEKIGSVLPEYQMIFDIASKIIRLMPDNWFSNDDDYVDVFYTLEKGKTYNNYQGASKNATITLVPYTISGR